MWKSRGPHTEQETARTVPMKGMLSWLVSNPRQTVSAAIAVRIGIGDNR